MAFLNWVENLFTVLVTGKPVEPVEQAKPEQKIYWPTELLSVLNGVSQKNGWWWRDPITFRIEPTSSPARILWDTCIMFNPEGDIKVGTGYSRIRMCIEWLPYLKEEGVYLLRKFDLCTWYPPYQYSTTLARLLYAPTFMNITKKKFATFKMMNWDSLPEDVWSIKSAEQLQKFFETYDNVATANGYSSLFNKPLDI